MKKIAIITFTAAAVISLVGCSNPTPVCSGEIHTVLSGDTLVAIAQKHCTKNIEAAIDQLVDQYGAEIHPGDQIQLPGNK